MRIQHVGIYVADVGVATDWYVRKLGFAVVARYRTDDGYSVVFVRSEASDPMLELVEPPKGSAELERARAGAAWVDHVAYEVEDIEAEYR
jgi:catechol 2,3-dioxygenase-like lactoylglutathione lyase family enzyme